jgi:L-alanine-DL-glutamate epimerase-like enolase superfamily enzyme
MKITEVETWHIRRGRELFDASRMAGAPMEWDVVVLRLGTDAGLDGYATCMAARSGKLTQTYLNDVLAPMLIGRDVTDREAIWYDMWTVDRHEGFFPIYVTGPTDVALWDIAAKAAGLPLYRYLGAQRSTLPVYPSSLWHDSIDDYVREAKAYQARGFGAFKVHPSGPWRFDMQIHRAVREAVGPDMVLMSDPVGEYTLDQAIRVGRDLEDLDYLWFEEPFRDFELDKYAQLCAALDIPIAATETTRGAHWGVAQVIAQHAADIVRADVSWKSGVTGTLKIAHLADAFGMNCEIHTTTMAAMDLVNLHVSCAVRNCEYFELFVPEEVFQFPAKNPLPIDSNGNIRVPETPGAMPDLDWDLIDDTCVSHQLTR